MNTETLPLWASMARKLVGVRRSATHSSARRMDLCVISRCVLPGACKTSAPHTLLNLAGFASLGFCLERHALGPVGLCAAAPSLASLYCLRDQQVHAAWGMKHSAPNTLIRGKGVGTSSMSGFRSSGLSRSLFVIRGARCCKLARPLHHTLCSILLAVGADASA